MLSKWQISRVVRLEAQDYGLLFPKQDRSISLWPVKQWQYTSSIMCSGQKLGLHQLDKKCMSQQPNGDVILSTFQLLKNPYRQPVRRSWTQNNLPKWFGTCFELSYNNVLIEKNSQVRACKKKRSFFLSWKFLAASPDSLVSDHRTVFISYTYNEFDPKQKCM